MNLICESILNPSYKGECYYAYLTLHTYCLVLWTSTNISPSRHFVDSWILKILTYVSGVINGTAPNPVRLGEMCNHLGEVMGRPSWLPVPDFALKVVLGEGASVVCSLPFLIVIYFSIPNTSKTAMGLENLNIFTVCRYWKGRKCFQLEPKNWVSPSNIPMWRMHSSQFFHREENKHILIEFYVINPLTDISKCSFYGL